MKRSSGWNQEVRDAQGRRRFHGAFTGGFSAGHFNTVGTEEGWAPSAFVSSRTSRAHVVPHRAEDFMDEEDDPLLGKRLETSEAFDTLHQNEKSRRFEAAAASDSKHPTFQVPDELILPMTGDSIGKKLLSQMGWKEGHGIGPRMRRRKLSIGSDDGETKTEDTKDDKDEVYYVPPRNTVDARVFPKPKTDKYGAGFDPYVDAPEFRQHKLRQEQNSHEHKPQRQIVTFAQALGNGNSRIAASNSRVSMGFGLSALEENDDLDVYDTTSMDDFDRAIGPAGEPTKLLDSMTSSARDKTRHDDVKSTAVLCTDGRPALEGFRIASKKLKPPKYTIERLQVPSDFQAYHVFKESEQEATMSMLYEKYNFSTEKSGRGSMMTAKQRATMLRTDDESGEQPSTAASTKPRGGSVFDLLGPVQREKLMGAAQAARERKPLVQSAPNEQFRANIMASISKRFVSASTTGDASAETKHDEAPVAQEKCSYRTEDAWAPHVLLCKRFRVKCEGATISGGSQSDELAPDLFTSELAPHLVDLAESRRSMSTSGNGVASISAVPAQSKSREEGEAELPPLPNVPKPSTDLLRSIFEPSDESDVDEDDDDDDAKSSEHDWEDKGDAPKEPAVVTSVKPDLTTQPLEVPTVSRENKPKDVALSTDESESSDDSDDSSSDGDRHTRKHKRHKAKKKHRKSDDGDERRRRKHKKTSRKADGSSRKATKRTEKKKKKTKSDDHEHDRSSRRARSRSRSRDRAHSRRA